MWSSLHGDLVGAFKTEAADTVTKLKLTSKDVLVGGTGESLIALWELFETRVVTIKEGKGNAFDQFVAQMIAAETEKRERYEGEEILFSDPMLDAL